MLSVELSEAQTSALVDRCREEEVTVNSALGAAFVGAQTAVRGDEPFHSSIGVAGSLRDRLERPVGEVMGFFAGVATLTYGYNGRIGFWENLAGFIERSDHSTQTSICSKIFYHGAILNQQFWNPSTSRDWADSSHLVCRGITNCLPSANEMMWSCQYSEEARWTLLIGLSWEQQ